MAVLNSGLKQHIWALVRSSNQLFHRDRLTAPATITSSVSRYLDKSAIVQSKASVSAVIGPEDETPFGASIKTSRLFTEHGYRKPALGTCEVSEAKLTIGQIVINLCRAKSGSGKLLDRGIDGGGGVLAENWWERIVVTLTAEIRTSATFHIF